jgi:membrane-bound inhibitor of C-type lysozyme
MKNTNFWLFLVIAIMGLFLAWQFTKAPTPDVTAGETFIAEAYYSCEKGKQIKARFFEVGQNSTDVEDMPIPNGLVKLELSDDRQLNLSQTISASGIRYANTDESIIFWNKGDKAFVIEDEKESFTNCEERIWKLNNESADSAVRNYILSVNELSWNTDPAGQRICIFQNLQPEVDLFPVYLWVRCSEYKVENNQLTELSGTSVPVKIDYPNELSYFDLSKFSISIPRDGSLRDADIKKIFPNNLLPRLNFESKPLNEKVLADAENQLLQ